MVLRVIMAQKLAQPPQTINADYRVSEHGAAEPLTGHIFTHLRMSVLF
jgi:hypothetical protein